ncbi:MAG TPA: MupA/Atu3671 family FMN-dependent luciferase-like monooxygenase [Pyrinomonadaceae bacterium]|nr:MupA/Atu3671 family FMN-dependent luciferase-like monooxygenase [Pyrinomonadaceae bacterium]
MKFGIMFFSSTDQQAGADKYGLLKKATVFADTHQFCAVWTPERHFAEFGGLFPNPSVTSAALAMITEQIQLRAGSLISPLHNSIRIAEEWAVVDQLSRGRVGISFGSGWNVDDFVFFPERYETRHELIFDQIDVIQNLWRGEALVQQNSFGKEVRVKLVPQPFQSSLPVWITSSGNPETFRRAGAGGFNILAHLLGQDQQALAQKIDIYRQARRDNGFDADAGVVSLMLHTFLGADIDKVKDQVRVPFRQYLKSAIRLERSAAAAGGVMSGGRQMSPDEKIPEQSLEQLLDITFERYFHTAALMGTVNSCRKMVGELEQIGVNEIACLIDFGVTDEAVMESLGYVDELRQVCDSARDSVDVDDVVRDFSEAIDE